MIEWLMWAQVGVALAVGLFGVGMAIGKKAPNDWLYGGIALIELGLVAQVVVAIVAPFVGNAPGGDALEFWVYLVTALLMPVAAAVWALVERSHWSSLILAAVAMAIAVMVWRMGQIWFAVA